MGSKVAFLLAGTAGIIALAVFSYFVRDSEVIWLQERALGLLSYLLLFTSVFMGELRLISKGKTEFRLFKHHSTVSVLAIFLVPTHFMSAVMDRFKWGRQLSLTHYLGFSFSNTWLTFLSFGVLAFYIMAAVGFTSMAGNIRRLGFRRWKIVHYLSYLGFFLAYVHTVNLGTDIKDSTLHYLLYPLTVFSFILVAGLLLTRTMNSFIAFSDQLEVAITAVFFILLLTFSALLASEASYVEGKVAMLHEKLIVSENAATTQESAVHEQYNGTVLRRGGGG